MSVYKGTTINKVIYNKIGDQIIQFKGIEYWDVEMTDTQIFKRTHM